MTVVRGSHVHTRARYLVRRDLTNNSANGGFLRHLFTFRLRAVQHMVAGHHTIRFFIGRLFRFNIFRLHTFHVLVTAPLA